MEPNEVIETDRLNAGYQFQGNYFYTRRKPLRRSMAGCFMRLRCNAGRHTLSKSSVAGDCKLADMDPMSHDTE